MGSAAEASLPHSSVQGVWLPTEMQARSRRVRAPAEEAVGVLSWQEPATEAERSSIVVNSCWSNALWAPLGRWSMHVEERLRVWDGAAAIGMYVCIIAQPWGRSGHDLRMLREQAASSSC